MTNGINNQKYSRLESNLSADTLDSVFIPNTPSTPLTASDVSSEPSFHINAVSKMKGLSSVDSSSHDTLSKPADSGFVEGRVEKKTCIEREYVHIIDISHETLLKEKKKKRLPEPNEETHSLVREMMHSLEKRLQRRPASAPATPLHKHRVDKNLITDSKKETKGSLGKKSLSSSIQNFFRKISMSPKTQKKDPKKKKGRRSKSAGRLEENRSLTGSSSSFGCREISIEPTSTESSEKSSTAAQLTLHRPVEGFASLSSEKKHQTKSTGYLDDKESITQSYGARKLSHRNITTNNNSNDNAKTNRSNSNDAQTSMPPAQLYLKSIKDHAVNNAEENNVYKTFKEKRGVSNRNCETPAPAVNTNPLRVVDNDGKFIMSGSLVKTSNFQMVITKS